MPIEVDEMVVASRCSEARRLTLARYGVVSVSVSSLSIVGQQHAREGYTPHVVHLLVKL